MSKYEYKPSGVCSVKIKADITDDTINSVEFVGGCSGNTQGISSLVKGMNVNEVVKRLEGIACGFKKTSCPNELAKFLKDYKKYEVK